MVLSCFLSYQLSILCHISKCHGITSKAVMTLLCYQLKYCWFDLNLNKYDLNIVGNPNNKHFYLYFYFFIGSLKDLQAAVQGLTWHDSTSTSTSDLAEVRSTHTRSHTHKEESYLKHPAKKTHAQYSQTDTMWTVISAVSTSLHLIIRSCFLSLSLSHIHTQ